MIVLGQIDAITKDYVRRPDIFADLFNFLIYNGESVIDPDKLEELDPTEILILPDTSQKRNSHQKIRDLLKSAVIMRDGRAAYTVFLGVENQTDIHYAMPVRSMLYDALNYGKQVSVIGRKNIEEKKASNSAEFLSGVRKNDKIVPVLTLVLYFGQDKWDGPVSLHEMFDVQDHELLKFIPDYRINLVSPVAMTKEEIGKFRSQFQALAGVIRFEQDKKELSALFESNEVFRHLSEDTVNVINAVTGAEIGYRTDEKGDVDMCKAIKEMLADSKVEGIQIGEKNQSIKNAETMIARGKYALEEIAENSGLSLEEVQEIATKRTA